MKKDPKIFIEHVLESIERIGEYIKGITKDQFLNSIKTQDAVIRRIEIIGEAVKNIPEKVKEEYPDIPWRKIAGMRDVVIHGYFGIDLELTWKVVNEDILDLKRKIWKIKKNLEKQIK